MNTSVGDKLVKGQFTTAAMKVFLAVFEGREWDCCYNYLDGNRGIYNDPMQGMRAIAREEWY